MEKQAFQSLCETVEDVILSNVEKETLNLNIEISEPELRDVVSGVFHKVDRPIYAIIAGRTNSGKSSVARQIFSDMAIGIRYGDEVVPVRDCPDVTQAVIRIPFGRDDTHHTEGFTLFDTPGLTADLVGLQNIARLALGLPQTGASKYRRVTVPFITLERPDENGIAYVKEDETASIDDLKDYRKEGVLNCIYVLNASETPFDEEVIADQIAALREIYQNRFRIVVTHEDSIMINKDWTDAHRKRRSEMIKEITGGKYTSVNGLTGDGVNNFAHEFLIDGGYYGIAQIIDALNIEMKASRLFSATKGLSDILIAAFFSKTLQEKPDGLMFYVLELLTELATDSLYGPDPDPKWKVRADKTIKKGAEAMGEEFVETKEVSIKRTRKAKGFREWWKTTFTDWKPTEIEEKTVEIIEDRVALLSHLYYYLYQHIYSLETEVQTEATPLTRDIISPQEAVDWFTKALKPHEQLLQDRDKAYTFYCDVGPVLERFWAAHHPEVLPVASEIPTGT